MDFRILGPLQVDDEDQPLPLGGKRARTVLACLVVYAGEIVPTSTIVQEVWGDDAPRTAVDTLQSYLSRLRRVLDPGRPRGRRSDLLVTHPSGYLLAIDPQRIDARRFEDLVARARCGPVEGSAAALRDALTLWRGRALDDIEWGPLLRTEVERLQELRITVLEERIEADLTLGLHTEVVSELQALVPAHPLRENLRALLMLGLYRAGRQAEALNVFSDARDALVEELGVEPGRRLQRLQADILAHSPHLDGPQATFGADKRIVLRAPEPATDGGNLPAPLDAFVGRGAERTSVAAQLADARLVTLIGAGGAGKTRLALAVAADTAAHFPGGVWLAPVPAAGGGTVLASVVAQALGMAAPAAAQTPRALVGAITDRLRGAGCLVLLDGCERDLPAAADLARELLVRCADLRVLATSRQPLHVAGERVRPVPPLPLPPPGATDLVTVAASPAAALFADRAAALQPRFSFDELTAPAVARICRALDGLPLALEEAARDLRLLSPDELADRLDGSLLLAGGPAQSSLACHHQPACAVGWSYRRLAAHERALLGRLSVFPGSFTVEAAEAVCAVAPAEVPAVLPALRALVDHSLVEAVLEDGRHARHRLLANTRTYAAQRLPHRDAATLGERHASYYTDLAEHARFHLGGPGAHAEARAVLGAEQGNLVAALEWTLRRGSMTSALVLARAVQSVRPRLPGRTAASLPGRRLGVLSAGMLVSGGRDEMADRVGA